MGLLFIIIHSFLWSICLQIKLEKQIKDSDKSACMLLEEKRGKKKCWPLGAKNAQLDYA